MRHARRRSDRSARHRRARDARGVAIGAHPGYPDLQGFGRREIALTPREIEAYVVYQIGAVAAACAAAGARMRYVKPHGALYNRAARDRAAADAIARAVRSVDATLILLALANSEMIAAADAIGLPRASEAFVDRAYKPNGTLVPRSESGAVLHDPTAIANRALQIVRTGTIVAADGSCITVQADSLCAHGDGADALSVVRVTRLALEGAGVRVAPFAE